MAAQTNYNYSTPKGVPGGKFDLSYDEVITRKNEEENGVLKFGMAVAIGASAGEGVKVPTSGTTAEQIEGVALYLPNTEQDMEGNVVVRKGTSLSIMCKGHVWARTASNVTPKYGEKAYVVVTGEDVGTFTNVSTNAVDIGATFGNASDDGIAVVILK